MSSETAVFTLGLRGHWIIPNSKHTGRLTALQLLPYKIAHVPDTLLTEDKMPDVIMIN